MLIITRIYNVFIRILKSIGPIFLVNVVSSIIFFVADAVYVKQAGLVEFGEYRYAVAILLILSSVFTFGVANSSLKVFCSRAKRSVRRYPIAILALPAMLAVLIITIAMIFAPDRLRNLTILLVIGAFLRASLAIIGAIFIAENRVLRFYLLERFLISIGMLMTISAALLRGVTYPIVPIVAFALLPLASLIFLMGWLFKNKRTRIYVKYYSRRQGVQSLLNNVPFAVIDAQNTVARSFPLMLAGQILAPQITGLVAFVLRFLDAAQVLENAVRAKLLPKLIDAINLANHQGVRMLFLQSSALLSTATLAAGSAAILSGLIILQSDWSLLVAVALPLIAGRVITSSTALLPSLYLFAGRRSEIYLSVASWAGILILFSGVALTFDVSLLAFSSFIAVPFAMALPLALQHPNNGHPLLRVRAAAQ